MSTSSIAPAHNLVCAIMAGGSGTRFWPWSTPAHPKQFLRLFGDRSLLAATFDRIEPLCGAARTVVITAERFEDAVLAELPGVRVIGEPVGRNTAPCMALAALAARQIHPEAVVALLPADHHVANAPAFREALATAAQQAANGHIVTLGIAPSRPETGYGYIEVGDNVEGDVYAVARFVEKPDLSTAIDYLAGGKHLWNGGIFVCRADRALEAIAKHAPRVIEPLQPLIEGDSAFDSPAFRNELAEVFPACQAISIDYAIAEREKGLLTVRLDAGWSDVGTWGSLLDHREASETNFTRGPVLARDTSDSVLLSAGPKIAAYGVEGIVVAATADHVLVMPQDRSQAIKDLVNDILAGTASFGDAP